MNLIGIIILIVIAILGILAMLALASVQAENEELIMEIQRLKKKAEDEKEKYNRDYNQIQSELDLRQFLNDWRIESE